MNQLFAKYDKLTELWRQVQSELGHVPREFDFVAWEDGPFDARVHHAIGVTKLHGQWSICHRSLNASEPDCEWNAWQPITDCLIAIRVKATKYIPKLKAELTSLREQFGEEVDVAIERLARELRQ